MKRVLVAGLLSLLPTLVLAQQHPCDVQQPTSGQAVTGQVLVAHFCVLATDTIEAAVITANGVPIDLGPVTTETAPNTNGYKQVGVLAGQYAPGTYVVTMSVYNHNSSTGALQESAPSSPFALSVLAVTTVPSAPIHLVIAGSS